MANPRQRRKLRSGSHKPVQHSRRAQKLLKKQPPIRGPKVLQEAWDGRKTVRQNYEALGLAASLIPTASGGTEHGLFAHAKEQENCEKAEGSASTPGPSNTKDARANGVPKGYGKIIRDAEGNVVDVELADDDEDEDAGRATGPMIEDVRDPSADDALAGWVALGSRGAGQGARTRVVQALEELSEQGGPRGARFASRGELGVLAQLVARHGTDVEGMARDRRLNASQRTAGELGRAIRRAGGGVGGTGL